MKLFIQSAIAKEWQGKTFINIIANDSEGVLYNGSSTEKSLLEKIGQEVELDVKDSGKTFNNQKQWYFNFPKEQKAGGFPKKDYTFEKRRVALECASRTGKDFQSVIKLANDYFAWLNQ